MPVILKRLDLEHAICLYQSGVSPKDIGEKFGVQGQSVRARLRKAGIRLRSYAESRALHLPPIDVSAIARAYRDGESVNAIAKRLGVSRPVISRRLLTEGVQLRSQSAAEAAKWSRMNPRQRRRQVQAAHVAASIKFRGLRPSNACLEGKALRWERDRPSTKAEAAVLEVLHSIGVRGQREHRVGPYNIDVALEADRIAIEIVASLPGPRYGPTFHQRCKYLLDSRWSLVFLYALKGNRNRLGVIAEKLPALLDQIRRDDACRGRYGVIRCDTKTTPALAYYLNGLPRIPGA